MATSAMVARPDLDVESEGGVVRLTLNRPDRRNALSLGLLNRLGEALEQVAADPSARVVVLSAEGPAFSAGHDLSEMVGREEADYRDLFGECSRVMQLLRTLPQPAIARVQGPAFAAGCQLVAACDLAVAAEGATFATPGVKIGLFCSTPMVPLVRTVPPKAALEMLLTGEAISASRALALGLVNRVVPAGLLDEALGELIAPILAASPSAIRRGKASFYGGLALDEPAAYDLATARMIEDASAPDAQEGISAFLQKRRARWSGA